MAGLCLSVTAFCQQNKTNQASTKFDLGIKAGANYSSISGEDVFYTYKGRPGFHGGFVGKYNLNNKMALQAEALFNNVGTYTDFGDNRKGNVEMQNITVPVSFQYSLLPQLYVETGPELNINLTTKHKSREEAEWELDWKEYSREFHYGWTLGAGYELTNNLVFNLRYSFGLLSPFKSSENSAADRFRLNNLQGGLIYFFK